MRRVGRGASSQADGGAVTVGGNVNGSGVAEGGGVAVGSGVSVGSNVGTSSTADSVRDVADGVMVGAGIMPLHAAHASITAAIIICVICRGN